MLLYPFAVVLANLIGLETASKILGDISQHTLYQLPLSLWVSLVQTHTQIKRNRIKLWQRWAVVKQLQENNARQETLDKAILQQAVETKEIFLTSLGKLGESLRDTLKDTSEDLTAAVLAPKKDDKLESQEEENQNRTTRLLKKIGGGIVSMGSFWS